jgi:replicative DNA helicase
MTRISYAYGGKQRLVVQAFYISAHSYIYQAAVQLHATYQPTDLLSVTAWLADHNLLNRIGDKNQLNARMLARITGVDAIKIQLAGNCAKRSLPSIMVLVKVKLRLAW